MNRITKGIYNLFAAYIIAYLAAAKEQPLLLNYFKKHILMKNNSYQRKPGEWKRNPQHLRADAWIDRIKTETKEEHVTRLRSMLLYTNPDSGGYYEHIDKLPRIYPSVEFGRSRNNGRKLKHYNGIVMLEVNRSGRIVRSGAGETAGGFVTTNLGSFCRK